MLYSIFASLTLGYLKNFEVGLVFNVVVQVTVRMRNMSGPGAKPQAIPLEMSHRVATND